MAGEIIVPTPTLLGIGDGARTQFSVGGKWEKVIAVNPTGVWRQDWQGNQRLYPTPRTNNFRSSVDLGSTTYWPRTRITSITPVAAPDGTNRASLITSDAAGSAYSYQSIAVVAGQKYEVSARAKAGTSNIAYFQDFTQTGTAQFLLSGAGSITAVTGTMSGATIEPLGQGWYRCTAVLTPTATGNINLTASSVRIASSTVAYFAPQVVLLGSGVQAPTSVIETTTAPATVTDYSVSSDGVFTFAQTPLPGARLTWGGSYNIEVPLTPPTAEFDSYRVDAQQRICENTLEVFRRNTVMRGIQTAQGQEAQELLDAFISLWSIRTLDNAQGEYLNVLGRIVGLWPRPVVDAGDIIYFGPDDDTTPPDWVPVFVTNAPTSGTQPVGDVAYRAAIRARIIKNHIKYGSAPELMNFAMFSFGFPVSVRNIGLADLEVVVPASAPPALLESIVAEVSDETADHKYALPIPVTGRIVRVFYRYPDAFAPDLDTGAPDVARIGVAHYVVYP